ncbi:MAG: hypothetical protein V1774_06370 [Candidatus Eisenbacteria bacterium]
MVPWDKAGGVRLPSVLALVAWSIAGGMFLSPAKANLAPPAPQEGILFHVQPVSADFCSQQAIWECSQLRQFTPEKGRLEFDLFVYTKRDEANLSLGELNLPLSWPADWELISWECCKGGQGELTPHRDMAELSIRWPERPVFEGRLMLAARFILEAPDCGWFGVNGLASGPVLRLGRMEGDLEVWWALPGWAQAGVECSHCHVPCDLLLPCRPELSPAVLELQALSGTETSGWIHVNSGRRCSPQFTTDAEWLTLDVGAPVSADDGVHLDVVVRANARGLAEGTYESWIHGTDDCVECVRVIFSVFPPPPSGVETSWGSVKSLFR